VLTARTVTGAERYEHSSTVKKSTDAPLPGSLEQTAAEVRARGVEAHVVKLDLSRREDWAPAVESAIARFGRIDVLVNNGRYVGPGHMDAFEETPLALYEQMFLCNVYAPLELIRLCLPHWKRQGGGMVINITSSAGQHETPQPIGKGGWGLGYSLTKAAFSRMVAGLAKELRPVRRGGHRAHAGLRRHRAHGHRARRVRLRRLEGPPRRKPRPGVRDARDVVEPMRFSGRDLRGPEMYLDHAALKFD
jgi:NAD(P)-dependent dehydrogenase (short-subunit alcohol dehydrogenase family)